MRSRRVLDVAMLGCAAVLAAALAVIDDDAGLPEFAFLTVLLGFGFVLLRLAVDAGRRAMTERRHARTLAATTPDDLARRAVVEERAARGRH